MARWELKTGHYLNVDLPDGEPVNWEYSEIDRDTGRARRRTFPVPMHLDAGVIVTDQEGTNEIRFYGDPTLDMHPLDAEAKAISDKVNRSRVHPIESLPANGDFSQSLIQAFERQMTEIARKGQGQADNVSLRGASSDEVAALKRQVEELTAMVAAQQPKPEDIEPLEDPAPMPTQSIPPKRQPAAQVSRRA